MARLQRIFPDPGIEPRSPVLRAGSLAAEPPGRPKHAGVGGQSLPHRPDAAVRGAGEPAAPPSAAQGSLLSRGLQAPHRPRTALTLLKTVLFSSRGLPAPLPQPEEAASGASASRRGDSRRNWLSADDGFSLPLGPRVATATPGPPAPSSERIRTPRGAVAAPRQSGSLARTGPPLPL